MDLEALSTDRTQWQTNTLEKISRSLGLMDHEDISLGERANSQKNVIVFGMTQAGKTCMLLAVAGISFNHQEYVETTLRAGQKKGGSSTSTAIIYKRSQNQKFGISYISNGEQAGKPVFFETDNQFQQELISIRKQVEKNQHPDERLIVYIPDRYFEPAYKGYNFNIIDLPGAGSRNALETAHVEKLRSRYFDAAHVKIIVCSIEENQSLQTANEIAKLLPAEDIFDWQTLRDEYILIVTSAYSMESVKKYFSIPRAERTKTFEEILAEKINSEVIPTFNADFNLEIFPLDVGESFQRLYTSLDEDDRAEVEQLRHKTIQRLMQSIEQRKGNTLKNVIDKMDARIKMDIKRQQENVEKKRAEIQLKILNAQNSEAQMSDDIEKMKNACEEISKQIDSLKQSKLRIASAKEKQFIGKRQIETLLQETCPGKRLKNTQRSVFLANFEKIILNYGCTLRGEIESVLNGVTSVEHFKKRIDWDAEFSRYLTNQIDALAAELSPVAFWKRAPLVEDVVVSSDRLLTDARNWLYRRVADITADIDKACHNLDNQKKSLRSSYEAVCRELKDIEDTQIPLLSIELRRFDEEAALIEEKRIDSKTLISKWLDMAKDEYGKQYKEYKRRLHSALTTNEEKIYLMIVMGLMEQDALKLLGLSTNNEGIQ